MIMMHLLSLLTLASTVAAAAAAGATAIVLNCESSSAKVTYRGLALDGIETFLGVPYAQDTSGSNRFKPPRPYVPQSGSTIDATKPGPACK